jgi:pimeloyl-ACP methyl ester carboxylesterase
MRPLEILLPVILAIYILWPLSKHKRPAAVGVLPAFALVVMVTHGRVEGLRWQMYPLYTIGTVTFLISLTDFLREQKATGIFQAKSPSRAGIILTLLLLAVSTTLPALLPVPTLMPPTGQYAVGTRTVFLTDPNRKEIYSGKDEPRKFIIQIWYPANMPDLGTKPAPWMPEADIVAPAIANYLHMPGFFFAHLTLAKSSAYEAIPAKRDDGPYPVLLFSHGWNGFRQQSTFLMQELASHGYIVVSIEHPYGARLTVFPDGSVAPNNPSALPSGKPSDEYEAAARILVDQWSGDIDTTLSYLTQLNQSDPEGQLTNLLALEKTGVFGHSTGGGATIQFCGTDPRCKAGLTLDAFMRPVGLNVLDSGTKQPFLYMFSELWPFPRNTELFDRYYSHVEPANRVVTILGTNHYDFTDLPALSPLAPALGLKGPINGARVQKIIDAYVLAFFDWQFKGIPSALFDGPQTAYPEVRYDH